MAYALTPEPALIYPEDDLLRSLVDLYFERINSVLPVLHKPSFMKSLNAGQHIWDASYGATVLLVCAIGARYSQDPRATVANDTSGLSAGWQYFCQVPLHRKSMFYKSTIYDLQYYCVRDAIQEFLRLLDNGILACNHLSRRNLHSSCLLERVRPWRTICS